MIADREFDKIFSDERFRDLDAAQDSSGHRSFGVVKAGVFVNDVAAKVVLAIDNLGIKMQFLNVGKGGTPG